MKVSDWDGRGTFCPEAPEDFALRLPCDPGRSTQAPYWESMLGIADRSKRFDSRLARAMTDACSLPPSPLNEAHAAASFEG